MRRRTCFLSVAGTWLKYSQACQNKIFSSLNSFFRNSCCKRVQSFVYYLQQLYFSCAVAVVQTTHEWRHYYECDPLAKTGVSVSAGVCGQVWLWLVVKGRCGKEVGMEWHNFQCQRCNGLIWTTLCYVGGLKKMTVLTELYIEDVIWI